MATLNCRRFSRHTNLIFFQSFRSACFLLIFAIFGLFVLFNFKNIYSNNELEYLQTQIDMRNSQIQQLKNELIDSNIRFSKLQNSESGCQKNYQELEIKCQKGQRKDIFDGFQRDNNFDNNAKPLRGDVIPNIQKQRHLTVDDGSTDEYPKLTSDGTFIPHRLWVHFDLKGAPLRPSYFIALLPFIKKLGMNGILIEWEDMFPYTGRLANAINGNAYTKEEIEGILQKAKDLGLEIVPLVQTFGHLEWILKLEEFAHLREDPKYPQVICFGSHESWVLIQDMINQVGQFHKRFGMKFFHIGADEVFQLGVCNESTHEIRRLGGRDKAILWHMSRTASFTKDKFSVTVLAWHDMIVQMAEIDIKTYNLPDLLEPILWSYAEDLDSYLPYSNWISLKPFGNVWGSSAFKGADGPMRIHTNPIHYIRNHESWIEQMTRVYKEFDRFQGLIITGWSRYDHLAVLCEFFPVAIPTLAMSVETILEGRPLNEFYEKSSEILHCQAPKSQGYAYGCKFPGNKIYELINELSSHSQQLHKYIQSDFEFNGWMSAMAEKWNYSSMMYIEKVIPYIDFYLQPIERIERELRLELPKYYYPEVVDEFILTYMNRDLEFLRGRKLAAKKIMQQKTFPKRPFIKFQTTQQLKGNMNIKPPN